MTPALPSSAAPSSLRNGGFLRRGVRTLGICVVIATVLSGWMNYSFLSSLAHSIAIGMLCWIVIDLGRQPLARWAHRNAPPDSPEALSDWPGWPLMLPLIGVGTLIGFSVGGTAAGWLTGHHNGGFFRGNLTQTFWLLLGAVVPGLLITYYFYAR